MYIQGNMQKLIIIDDEASVRDSLALLFSQEGYLVVTFRSAEEFISSRDFGTPCCAILDINLGGISGIDTLKIITNERLPMQVVIISAYGNVQSVRETFKFAAFDFIEKPYAPDELMTTVRQAFDSLPVSVTTDEMLTPREREVQNLLLQGKQAKEIANELSISVRTVEVHKGRIFDKLNVRNTLELMARSRSHSRSF